MQHIEDKTETQLIIELVISLFDLPDAAMSDELARQCGLSALELLEAYGKKLATGDAVELSSETSALLSHLMHSAPLPGIH